jgi:hypothetical protein
MSRMKPIFGPLREARREMSADADAEGSAMCAKRLDSSEASSMTLHLAGDTHPDVLFRVASQLHFFNSLPQHFCLRRLSDDTFEIEIVLLGASEQHAEIACRKLQQLTCVSSVEAVAADGTPLFSS